MAIRLQWRTLRNYLGALAVLIMLAGCLDAGIRVLRRDITAERTLYVGLVAVAWAVLFGLRLRLGESVWGRYCLFVIAFTFPLTAAWLHRWVPSRRIQLVIAAACLALFAQSYFAYRPGIFVTTRRFPDINAFVAWRASSTYSGDAVLVTRMNWEAAYVPFYAPELAGRAFLVAPQDPDARLRDFVRWKRPGLLVTRADDTALVRHVEQIFGQPIGPEHLVNTIGQLQVFDIRHLNQNAPTDAAVR